MIVQESLDRTQRAAASLGTIPMDQTAIPALAPASLEATDTGLQHGSLRPLHPDASARTVHNMAPQQQP